ncbi:MAG: Nickel uptake substrate-specific transmembrane region [Methanocella sp. PtaU1.Bin125]|nr:MAG: Nickel uptake substrate-specific transmembrane region [Methanocella sp. PtaU1.Bin125]
MKTTEDRLPEDNGLPSTPSTIDGRTLWLEKGEVNGKKIDVILRSGHHLKTEGTPDIRRISAAIIAPDGARYGPAVQQLNNGVLLRFHNVGTGFFTVMVRHGPAPDSSRAPGDNICWTTKAIVEAGKKVRYFSKLAGDGLEIVPREPYLETGKPINLAVFLEGKKAVGALLTAYSEKTDREDRYVIGRDGRARVTIDAGGRWLFTATYIEPMPGVADVPKRKHHETTLLMNTITWYQ